MVIEVIELLGVTDHILPAEKQHWVSPTFIARHMGGTPRIVEPAKCSAIGWFSLRNPYRRFRGDAHVFSGYGSQAAVNVAFHLLEIWRNTPGIAANMSPGAPSCQAA
jgi:hypothetical protein